MRRGSVVANRGIASILSEGLGFYLSCVSFVFGLGFGVDVLITVVVQTWEDAMHELQIAFRPDH